MVRFEDYFGPWINHKDVTPEVKEASVQLLTKVNACLELAFRDGVDLPLNPHTKSHVSGKQYGGFRPQDCPQGSPKSSHKVGRGVDIYDPADELDRWCMAHQDTLRKLGLFMEHPKDTPRWTHLTDRAPASGRTVFHP